MLFSLLVHCLVRHEGINIPASYLTLEDLASLVAQPGERIEVDSRCAHDCYAVRAVDSDWDSLKSALLADGRLTIERLKSGWSIKRSDSDLKADRRSVNRVVASVSKQIQDTFGVACSNVERLQALPQKDLDEQGVGFGASRALSGETQFSDNLTYLWYENERQYFELSVPKILTFKGSSEFLNKTQSSQLSENLSLFFPDGKISKFFVPMFVPKKLTDEEILDTFKKTNVWAKICFDPYSLRSTCKIAVSVPSLGSNGLYQEGGSVWAGMPSLKLAPAHVWLPEEVKSLNFREENEVNCPDVPSGMPTQVARASEVILKTCDVAGQNVVCYVSCFDDPAVLANKRTSVKSLLEDLARSQADTGWKTRVVQERLGDGAVDRAVTSAFALKKPWTVAHSGTYLVVRDELRFLDVLCSSPPDFSSSILNSRLHNEPVGLDKVSLELSKLPVHDWTTSHFSSNYLDICNPLSFRPIALALLKSKVLQNAMVQADAEAHAELTSTGLEPEAMRALKLGLEESSMLCDSGPTCAPASKVFDYSQPIQITIDREPQRFVVTVAQGRFRSWKTWIKNVDMRPKAWSR